jgi:UDP:flavonoid glycosyltransferase YjiC (YdhE family)
MKILYAWEIGEDLGHIVQFLPLALELRYRGHEVVTVLRELPRAEGVLGRHGLTMLQAPIWQGDLLDPPQAPLNYAEILFFYGYLDASRLAPMIKAWVNLISLIKPDMIIADHAPTALIAAKVLGIARTTLGAGFFLPPATSPFPNMRPWLNVSLERLMQSDERVLKATNTVLAALSVQPLGRLSEMFEGATHFLTTFAELDPYVPRDPSQRYYGPILNRAVGAKPDWPFGSGPRVFAYLKPHYRLIEEVLGALRALKCRTAAFIGGLSSQALARARSDTVSLSVKPYDMAQAAAECDFGICHAGHGTTCELLLKGKPLLLLPMHLEQHLTARQVSEVGAGVLFDQEDPNRDFKSALGQLIDDASLAQAAERFARRHAGISDLTIRRIVDECEAMA